MIRHSDAFKAHDSYALMRSANEVAEMLNLPSGDSAAANAERKQQGWKRQCAAKIRSTAGVEVVGAGVETGEERRSQELGALPAPPPAGRSSENGKEGEFLEEAVVGRIELSR